MNLEQVAKAAVALAQKYGATQAEAYLEWGRSSSVSVRDGEVEDLTESIGKGLGLRVIVNGRLGFSYTSDFDPASMESFVERCVALAKVSAQSDANVLPDRATLARRNPKQQLFDPRVAESDPEWKLKTAIELERLCKGFDPRITKMQSVGAGEGVSRVCIASSEGLLDSYESTQAYLYAAPVASQGDELQVGSWSESRMFLADLPDAEFVAKKAAHRAVRMLGARKVSTQRVPVVFDPQMAGGFIGTLAGAVSGQAVYLQSSFLAGKLGEKIAPDFFTVVDDGLLERGLGTSPFDGEGVATRTTPVIEGGVLKSYLYDVYTAKKAKAETTGNAARSYGSVPSISVNNFYLKPGTASPESLLKGIKSGLYVTGMMGSGVNLVTGEYSRGASGFWIEDGALAYPVQECTVAGHLLEMMKGIDAIADDVVFRSSVVAPTLRFGELTVSGK
jgi:PmbA protein